MDRENIFSLPGEYEAGGYSLEIRTSPFWHEVTIHTYMQIVVNVQRSPTQMTNVARLNVIGYGSSERYRKKNIAIRK